ncbi:MAG: hypothetical protein FWG79_01960 [Bacteroidales bacterium]|nr:hypothetical protein [Bacteroidales bacterium]
MTNITLEYDFNDVKTQKTLDYILSLGLFRPVNTIASIDEFISEKRKKLDNDLKNYLVDLSEFKFNRDEANIYE